MAMLFFLSFAVCFIAYFSRSTIHALEHRKRIRFGKKQYKWISLLAFAYWFSWFSMLFNDPSRTAFPDWAAYTGLALFLVGTLMVVMSHKQIPSLDDKGYLRKRGLYAKIRHPMYLGFALWVVGLPMFMQTLFTLLSAAIWIVHMVYWAILEEKALEKKFPGYAEYRKQTLF